MKKRCLIILLALLIILLLSQTPVLAKLPSASTNPDIQTKWMRTWLEDQWVGVINSTHFAPIEVWTPATNITIVGVYAYVMSDFGNRQDPSYDDGDFAVQTEISLSPEMWQDGCILQATAVVGYWHVGGLYGDRQKECSIMFPAGHGINVDAGQNVYLHGQMSGDIVNCSRPRGDAAYHAIIYYIER